MDSDEKTDRENDIKVIKSSSKNYSLLTVIFRGRFDDFNVVK